MQAQQKTIAALREQLESLSQGGKKFTRETLASSWPELNQLLPGGGFRSGDLWEWVADDSLAAAATVSLLAARSWITLDRPAILLQRSAKVFPPALHAAGFDLQSLVEVHAADDRDRLWAWEQALGCPAVSLVWGEMPRIAPLAYRRLKLAVEASGTIGFLLRPPDALKRPTWADGRLLVTPLPSTDESPRFVVEMNPEPGGGRKVEIAATPPESADQFRQHAASDSAAELRQRVAIHSAAELRQRVATGVSLWKPANNLTPEP